MLNHEFSYYFDSSDFQTNIWKYFNFSRLQKRILELWKYALNHLHRFAMMRQRKLKIITFDWAMTTNARNIPVLSFKTFGNENFIGIETDEQTNKHHPSTTDRRMNLLNRCRAGGWWTLKFWSSSRLQPSRITNFVSDLCAQFNWAFMFTQKHHPCLNQYKIQFKIITPKAQIKAWKAGKCAANILKSNLFIMYVALMLCCAFRRCFL